MVLGRMNNGTCVCGVRHVPSSPLLSLSLRFFLLYICSTQEDFTRWCFRHQPRGKVAVAVAVAVFGRAPPQRPLLIVCVCPLRVHAGLTDRTPCHSSKWRTPQELTHWEVCQACTQTASKQNRRRLGERDGGFSGEASAGFPPVGGLGQTSSSNGTCHQPLATTPAQNQKRDNTQDRVHIFAALTYPLSLLPPSNLAASAGEQTRWWLNACSAKGCP